MTEKLEQYSENIYHKINGNATIDSMMMDRRLGFLAGFQLGAEFAELATQIRIGKDLWNNEGNGKWSKPTVKGHRWVTETKTTPELIDLFLTDKMKEK